MATDPKPTIGMARTLSRRPGAALALLLAITALAYARALGGELQLDDPLHITENPAIRDLASFLRTRLASGLLHGARGVLQRLPEWTSYDVNDALCAPHPSVEFVTPTGARYPAIGDDYLDLLPPLGSWRWVTSSTHVPGPLPFASGWRPSRVDASSSEQRRCPSSVHPLRAKPPCSSMTFLCNGACAKSPTSRWSCQFRVQCHRRRRRPERGSARWECRQTFGPLLWTGRNLYGGQSMTHGLHGATTRAGVSGCSVGVRS